MRPSVAAFMVNLFFVYVIVKNHNPLVRNLKFSYNSEDLKMKKLLLNLLVVMSKSESALQVSHRLVEI